MPRNALRPAVFPYFDPGGLAFSLGVETPDGAVLAGHTAARYDPDLGRVVVAGGLSAQARVAYEKVGVILAAAGLGYRDVARLVEYITPSSVEEYPLLAGLRRAVFGDEPPATSTIVVEGLLRPEALIEVEATAARARPPGSVEPLSGAGGAVARHAGDLLYIPALAAVGTDGTVAGAGDLVRQAQVVYAQAGRVLERAGLGWQHVLKTVDVLTAAGLGAYRDTASVRRQYLGGGYPAATGIVMPRLAHPEALLQVEFIAAAGPRATINPGWSRYDHLTYAPAVRAGRLLLLSGQIAADPETGTMEHVGDVVGQCRTIYRNLCRVLAAAGAGPDAVVKTVEFVTPSALVAYRHTAAVRREVFAAPFPAATGVVCSRLLHPEALLEVEAVAVLP